MDNSPKPYESKDLLRKVTRIDAGILVAAWLGSFSLKLPFGITLFGLGMIASGVGAYLGRPRVRYYPKPEDLPSEYWAEYSGRPPQAIYDDEGVPLETARRLYDLKNSVPPSSAENALLWAGLIAMLVSLPFLCWIAYK